MTFEAMLEEERDEAREEGLSQGRNEGRAEANKELAKGFRDAGVSVEVISKQTGLTPEEIQAL